MATGIIPKNVTVDESNFKTYDSLADLGLATNGTATIQQAVDALVARQPAALFCRSSEFDSSEVPNPYGEIRIVSLASNRTTIDFKAQTPGIGDYRMFLNGQSPAAVTGTWLKIRNAKDSSIVTYDTVKDLGLEPGQPDIIAVYNAMPESSLLFCKAMDFVSTSVPSIYGSVRIMKTVDGTQTEIAFFSKTGSGDYSMYLNTQNTPTGTWVQKKYTDHTYKIDYKILSYSSASKTLSANSRTSIDISLPAMSASSDTNGYYRVGILGYQVGNGTSGAENYIMLGRISNITSLGATTVWVNAYNHGSSSLTFKVILSVMAIKITQTGS